MSHIKYNMSDIKFSKSDIEFSKSANLCQHAALHIIALVTTGCELFPYHVLYEDRMYTILINIDLFCLSFY